MERLASSYIYLEGAGRHDEVSAVVHEAEFFGGESEGYLAAFTRLEAYAAEAFERAHRNGNTPFGRMAHVELHNFVALALACVFYSD